MKKGFTLIELLAVIVILAIIAVIAVPIVLNIINDTKESALLRSADFYIDAVEQSIMKKEMAIGSDYNPDLCIVQEDGNLLCDNKETVEVKVTGYKPSDGRIIFANGEIIDFSLKLEDKIVLNNGTDELIIGNSLIEYIRNLYKETTVATVKSMKYSLDETHLLINDRLGNSNVAKTDGNIRYYGANPNNYIDIGDRDAEGNIIFWRIIGLFKDVEVTDEEDNVIRTEDLVKIIRADHLVSGNVNGFSRDYKYDGTKVTYSNVWSDSTLNSMLNDIYYNSDKTNYYNNSKTRIELDFLSTGLSNKIHNKIERVKWNLGTLCSANNTKINANTAYKNERSGTNSWSGKIALMYPSDFGYSSDLTVCNTYIYYYNNEICKSTNWIYDSAKTQWLFSTNTSNSQGCVISKDGSVNCSYGANGVQGVRPVLYLNSDVAITEEKETNGGLKYFVVE